MLGVGDMDRMLLIHYFFPGTDPWKNIMLLPEEEAFSMAKELSSKHPDSACFGRFADFENYYPVRKETDAYVRERFVELGGKPALSNPYAFTLGECNYLKDWFSDGDKIVFDLTEVPDDQISFTMGDSCALIMRGQKPEVLTKAMLLDGIHSCGDSLAEFLKKLPEGFGYVEAQLWTELS